jgi:L-fuconolactonase
MKVVDSHVHFVDPERPEGLVWPAEDSPLNRQFLPVDRQRAASGYELYGCIAIETSRRPADDQWLLELAMTDPFISGVVLNLQPDKPGFESRLESASKYDAFVGIRLRPIEEYDLASPSLHRSFFLIEKVNKTIEFGAATCDAKHQFANIAKTFPGIRWILDHCGHPRFDGPPDEDWLADMEKIAALPNVVTKVTGIEVGLECCRPTLQALKQMFGAERLIYGSNWPVSHLDAIPLLQEFFADDADAFFSRNARKVYGI